MLEGLGTGHEHSRREVQVSPDVHRIDIAPCEMPKDRYWEKQQYRVLYRGETLIERTWEPVYSSCRALVARGLTGRLEIWGGEQHARGIVRDIVKGAGLTIIENENVGPKLPRYKAVTGFVDARIYGGKKT
jgi:hypothetical protein